MTTSFGNARGVISLDFFYKGATTIGKYAELLIIYNQLVINFFEKRRGIFFEKTKIRKKKSRECYNYKSQPFPDTERKPNKRKSNKRTKFTKISFYSQARHRNATKTRTKKDKT